MGRSLVGGGGARVRLEWAAVASLAAGRSHRFAGLFATIVAGRRELHTSPPATVMACRRRGKYAFLLVCRGEKIARVQLALAAFLSENEDMKHEVPTETRFFAPFAAHASILSSSALLFCTDEASLSLHPKKTNSYANAILSEQSPRI